MPTNNQYQRYHIDTQPAPDFIPWPNRFEVKVNRIELTKLLIGEIFHLRGDMKAVTSRPCMYGTFSGPVGGFAPRPQFCVGCLRCTTQHPQAVTILPNPARASLGDSFFSLNYVNAVSYEAETGSIPVKGAGYRGAFGGPGWDGMWTDMSEIVRPTRDGIHGREFISTVIDIGEKPSYLIFDKNGEMTGAQPLLFSIPLPFIFDIPPASAQSDILFEILTQAAAETQTLAVVPVTSCKSQVTNGKALVSSIVPLVKPGEESQLEGLDFSPKLIEIEIAESATFRPGSGQAFNLQAIRAQFPDALIAARLPYGDPDQLLSLYHQGARVFHLVADLHGRGADGRFVMDLIREAHLAFVEAGVRDEVTLLGSGGIIAAEHVPKAVISGLDAVALDTPLLVALQAHFEGECPDRDKSRFELPKGLPLAWGKQRIQNLTATWRDQLLEIMGAMGIREVRRLRGEIGRAMFQVELEREAFAEIEGYPG